jgi:trk/ktr system potassium uptake protein
MKVVIVGASSLGISCAKELVKRKVDVVLVEQSKERIAMVSEELDAGIVHGNGTKPAILRETGPGPDVLLFCLTGSDQNNILAALVGRSLGFARVIPKLDDPEFQHICLELGLTDTIIPDLAVGATLADMAQGRHGMDLSAVVRGDVRFFSFVVPEDAAGPLDGLLLPDDARPICVYRKEASFFPDEAFVLKPDDEVVIITRAARVPTLEARWAAGAGHPASVK